MTMPRDPRLDPQNGDVVECKHEGDFVSVTVVSVYATDYDVNVNVVCDALEKHDTITIFDWWDMNRVVYPELDLERIDDKWLVRLTGMEHEHKRPHELKFICDSVAHIVERFNIKVAE